MRTVLIYHGGCPDGFGAAWAARRRFGDALQLVPRGHNDGFSAERYQDAHVIFVDIAPPPDAYRPLAEWAEKLTVLDHHVSAKRQFEEDPALAGDLAAGGHQVLFDLTRSGAVLSWNWFHPGEPTPDLLRYVEDQDLWNWKLEGSREVNAVIASYPRDFVTWDRLAEMSVQELVREGTPIARAERIMVERALESAHPVRLGDTKLEAVNAHFRRNDIGHALAERARFGMPAGAVYRVTRNHVDVSVYSIGDFDMVQLAARYGGGGHSNAAGFSMSLKRWLDEVV